jgi:hypothetical protein
MARGTTFNISRRTLLSGMAGMATFAVTSCALPASGGQQGPSSADEMTGARLPIDSFDMHADTIDVLGMRSHAPYASFNNKFSGDLADTNAQISANRMGGVRWAQCYAIWIPENHSAIAPSLLFSADTSHSCSCVMGDYLRQCFFLLELTRNSVG